MTDVQKPYSKYDVLRRQPKHGNVQQEPKSYAQVESWVSPQGGVTNSGGLKPEKKEKKKANNRNIRKRANPLTVRLSEKDIEIITQKAFNIGYSVNAYVRAAALGSHYKPPISRDMVMALLAVKRELTAQGRNLNQIAHRHNSSLVKEAETNSMLGILAMSMINAHDAVGKALAWGKEYPENS